LIKRGISPRVSHLSREAQIWTQTLGELLSQGGKPGPGTGKETQKGLSSQVRKRTYRYSSGYRGQVLVKKILLKRGGQTSTEWKIFVKRERAK